MRVVGSLKASCNTKPSSNGCSLKNALGFMNRSIPSTKADFDQSVVRVDIGVYLTGNGAMIVLFAGLAKVLQLASLPPRKVNSALT